MVLLLFMAGFLHEIAMFVWRARRRARRDTAKRHHLYRRGTRGRATISRRFRKDALPADRRPMSRRPRAAGRARSASPRRVIIGSGREACDAVVSWSPGEFETRRRSSPGGGSRWPLALALALTVGGGASCGSARRRRAALVDAGAGGADAGNGDGAPPDGRSRRSAWRASPYPPTSRPGPEWQRIIAGAPDGRDDRLQPEQRTGHGDRPGLHAGDRQAPAAGITVLGYVSTNYGQRAEADVVADINALLRPLRPVGHLPGRGADGGGLRHDGGRCTTGSRDAARARDRAPTSRSGPASARRTSSSST